MKVRVTYTVAFSDEALACWARYHGRKLTREEMAGHLQTLGESGVDEQIYEGGLWLKNDAERAAEEGVDDDAA